MKTWKYCTVVATFAIAFVVMTGCEQPTNSPPKLIGISLNTTSVKKDYIQNETLNLSSLVVTANYSDGSSAAVTTYTSTFATGATLSTTGTTTITISYTEGKITKTAEFYITVTAPTSAAITYSVTQAGGEDGTTDSAGIIFIFNGSVTGLTASDITVTNGTGIVTKGILTGSGTLWSLGVTVTTAGNITVSINKSGIEMGTKNVTIYKAGQAATTKTFAGIALNTASVKTDYTQNETLNLYGLVVIANYSDDSSTAVIGYTSSLENGSMLSTIGIITVTISYTEGAVTRSANFTVTVTEPIYTDPTVTNVTVSSAGNAAFVNKGGALQFNAVVNGTNNPAQTVTWSIVTVGIKAGTSISTDGLLTVAGDETALMLFVEATSTFDPTKNGTAAIDVIDPNLLILSGNISITVNGSPVTTATTGTRLTAVYSGSESVTYQWNIDGEVINKDGWAATNSASSATYTPYGPGSYNVIVSAPGYNSKISSPVTVTGNEIPPESWSVADRWSKWIDTDSIATVDYSVGNDGVCAITVSGAADPANWKVNAQYRYTAAVNTTYEYRFEAWTQSGERTLGIQYYYDNDDLVYLYSSVTITTEQKTYTVKGQSIPKGNVYPVEFQGAEQLGTFYVKVLSITPYTPQLEYELIDDYWSDNYDTYRLVSATGIGGAVTIPATYNGLPVTEIDYEVFRDNKSITGVSIPAGVTSIGYWAFIGCSNLTSITVANGNYYYSSAGGILYNYDRTELVAVPGAISGTVTIPAYVISIGSMAFAYCSNLTTVTFAAGSQLDSIGSYAFGWCRNLTSITIPATVIYIENAAFAGCSSLTSITVANGNYYYSSAGGILYSYDKTVLVAAPGAISGTVTIPNSVTGIGIEAFRNCERLTGVTFAAGSQLEGIGYWAFAWCPNIVNITIPATVTYIGWGAFESCTSLTSVTFATGSSIDEWNFEYNAFPEGINGVGGDDLRYAYLAGGAGRYRRASGGSTWTKQ